MKHLDVVRATYKPQRTDDLKPGVATDWIGRRLLWLASWVVEADEGEYAGQWAMRPWEVGDAVAFRGWAPLCDLADVEPVEEGCSRKGSIP